MNKTTIRVIISVLVILLFIPCIVNAQEEVKEDTPYWYIMHVKVAFAKMDSLAKYHNDYYIPVVEEAKKQGTILDEKWLQHHTGSEYTIVMMTKYPSWAAINVDWFSEALKAIEPDKAKRKVYGDTFDYLFDGFIHYDEILTEMN